MAVRIIDGKWYIDIRFEGRRYRKKSQINTKGLAKAYEHRVLEKLIRGEPLVSAPPLRRPSFEGFAWEWYELYARTNNKASEQRNKEIALRLHLVPFFGRLRLDDINARDIERYKVAKQSYGLSNKTINGHLAIFGRCLRSAIEWKQLERMPTIKMLRAPTPPIEVLTDQECSRLLADRSEPMWRCMILMALRTGMRFGELIGLDWSTVSLEHRLIDIRQSIVRGLVGTPKSGKSRIVPVDDDLVVALLELGSRQAGLVFHRDDGRPLSYRIAENAIHRICRRAAVRPIGWHTLRHTFATQLCQERVPIRDVQVLLGHSTLAMTERYTHVTTPRLFDAVAVLRHRQASMKERGPYVGTGLPVVLSTELLPHLESAMLSE